MARSDRPARVSLAGFGAVGQELARRLIRGVPGVELVAVAARDPATVARRLHALGEAAAQVRAVALEELEPLSDIVIECLPAELLPIIAEPVVRAGKEIVVLSAGALLQHGELIELASAHGGTITVPTGALLGLDALAAAAEANVSSVRIVSRKPGRALAGAPHLDRSNIDVDGAREAVRVFSGTAREAAEGFPANLNVAAALALAGIGPERTEVEVWLDPAVTKNTHTISVRSDVADFEMTIENVPSENPRTGQITALSVVALLRKRFATLAVGT